ncbi:hypothetical protein EJB05_41259, partial [Eragrostis curvula]
MPYIASTTKISFFFSPEIPPIIYYRGRIQSPHSVILRTPDSDQNFVPAEENSSKTEELTLSNTPVIAIITH